MSSAFIEGLQQQFAGQMTEGEKQLCQMIRELLRATMDGRVDFHDAMLRLHFDLQKLREFRYDVDAWLASGYKPIVGNPPLEQVNAHRPTEPEKEFLQDMDGLIDFASRNGLNFWPILIAVGHDVGELKESGFSFDAMSKRFVLPKVTGWAKRNVTPFGDPDEPQG